MSEEKTRPAATCNFKDKPGREGDYHFDDDKYKSPMWPRKDKNGSNYVVGSCANCGHQFMAFFNKYEGWKLVKDNVEPDEEF